LHKAGQSAVIAYIVLGVAFGPSGFGLADSTAEVQNLSQLGVIFLLFFIGLDFQVETLKRSGRLALGSVLQILGTAVPTAAVGALCGLNWRQNLVLGVCAALSSTAIIMKAFEDRQEDDSLAAQTSVVISVGQDVIALLAVAAMPALLGGAVAQPAPGSGPAPSPWTDFGIMLVALPALYLAAHRIFPWVFRRAAVARNQEGFALCSLGACLLVAVLAAQLKGSLTLGAFLGGLVFAGTPYATQIRADLATVRNLALGFFFFTVGLLLDLRYVAAHPFLVSGALIGLLAVKAVFSALAVRAVGQSWSIAAAAGIALCPVSEFAFVMAAEAGKYGVLTVDHQQLLMSVTVASMLIGPSMVARAIRAGRRVSAWFGDAGPESPTSARELSEAPTGQETVRAVVVGYGPVGRTLCKILIRFGVSPCVIDLHLDTVRRLHEIDREAVFGDASKREVLEAAGVSESRYLIVTLPDLASRAPILTSARQINPGITVISRARYLTERAPLETSGADHIAYEEAEVAAELARLLLGQLGVSEELLKAEVRKLRAEIAVRTGFTQVFRRPFEAPAGQTEVWTAAQLEEQLKKDAAARTPRRESPGA
ncbi:MAG TPA: cation:proton antiporter, partial [Planctomycetota bacterium]|nr:cation:proton antiporter [Planctomycetota bacterium]